MISINNLTVEFGSFTLFEKMNFLINSKDRLGLVGKNGAGKSTLLKIIAGLQTASSGNISIPSGIKIGYLPQQMQHAEGKTVMNEALSAFEEVIKLEKEIEEIQFEISNRSDYESDDYMKLIGKLTDNNDRYHFLEGENIDAEAEKTLQGLGFVRNDFSRETSEFSGGWRMRIELAKILLQKPDVFLLDEPTNHLDIESIQWLEDFLKSYPGAVILVSHDRAFLDNITNRTLEISMGKIYDYKVPYSHYVALHAERREQQMKAYVNQQKMIKDTEEFIERFRYKASKAVQVQSRIKHLEKLERIQIDDEDLSQLNLKFPPAPRSGDWVCEAENLSKSYGNHLVLNELNFSIRRGEKIAFVGKNGAGKSTLVKILTEQLEHSGVCKLGYNVKIGYFAQNQAQLLDDDKTIFETIDDVAVGDVRTKIRHILGAFMFRGEDVDKKVKVLSGGERSRLAMIRLLLEPVNFLILDEPTNHLDMKSKDVLKEAICNFNGTVVVVSHDRDFLDALVSKIYEFSNTKIKEHFGGIYDFLHTKKIESLQELETKNLKLTQQKVEKSGSKKPQTYQQSKELSRKISKTKKQLTGCEENIMKFEALISGLEKEMSDPEKSNNNELFKTYEDAQEKLEKELLVWERCSEQLENLLQEKGNN